LEREAALARGGRRMPRRRRVTWRREVVRVVGGIGVSDGGEILAEEGRYGVAPGGRVAVVFS
jgi:hypothetical protein